MPSSGLAGADGNGDAASIDGGHRSLVSPYQPFEGERISVLSCRFPRSYQLRMEATLMLLNDVFERFAQDSPVPVMVRGPSGEHALAAVRGRVVRECR